MIRGTPVVPARGVPYRLPVPQWLLDPWRSGRLWPSLAHTALDVPVGFLATVPSVVLVMVALATAITLPLALVPFAVLLVWSRLIGALERSRGAALLGQPLEDPVEPLPRGLWRKVTALATSRARWKGIAYCLVRLPVGVVLHVVVFGCWSGSVALVGLPLYLGGLPDGTARFGPFAVSSPSSPSCSPPSGWPGLSSSPRG